MREEPGDADVVLGAVAGAEWGECATWEDGAVVLYPAADIAVPAAAIVGSAGVAVGGEEGEEVWGGALGGVVDPVIVSIRFAIMFWLFTTSLSVVYCSDKDSEKGRRWGKGRAE